MAGPLLGCIMAIFMSIKNRMLGRTRFGMYTTTLHNRERHAAQQYNNRGALRALPRDHPRG